MKKQIRLLTHIGVIVAMVLSLGIPALIASDDVLAEGTSQMNDQQVLSESTDVYFDILEADETINISLCENADLEIYDTLGTFDLSDDVLVDSTSFTANLDCSDPLPNPITGAYTYTPETTGAFRIDFVTANDDFRRYDFSVTASDAIQPNPTLNDGRIWSYLWRFSANDDIAYDDGYPEETSTDANLFALVPAPDPSENFVWKLDLNNFAGGSYRLMANSTGLDAPYAGMSASMEVASVQPQYPLYLSYPDIAGQQNTTIPDIAGFSFLDDAGEDDTFSPGTSVGVQDEGVFRFNSNVENATYAITIDTNQDGLFGTGDRILLGEAALGANEVTWDGTYPNGDPVPVGNYDARLQLRIGEFHFVARDVEASGGTQDGVTWANGLTIYKALDQSTTQNTMVYWDDITSLAKMVWDDDAGEYVPNGLFEEATSNLPNGVVSGSLTDANNDGKADGFHTWGDFEEGSMGDDGLIDTFTYGEVDAAFTTVSVAEVDGTDDDGVSSGVESSAPNDGDGNGDGTPDHLQDDVTSLPNPVTGGYSTIQAEGCTALSNVSIMSESELGTQDQLYGYPVGLADFTINCEAPGGTADVTIFYDRLYDTSGWQARKFINGQYSAIDGAEFGTATVGEATVTTLRYSVEDGGPLDADGIVNGTIVDPAGPGVVSAAAPNTGIRPLGATGAIVIAGIGLVSLTGVTVYTIRRRAARQR